MADGADNTEERPRQPEEPNRAVEEAAVPPEPLTPPRPADPPPDSLVFTNVIPNQPGGDRRLGNQGSPEQVNRGNSLYQNPNETGLKGEKITELSAEDLKREGLPAGSRRQTGRDANGREVTLTYGPDNKLLSEKTVDGKTTVTKNYGENGSGSVTTEKMGENGKPESSSTQTYENGKLKSESQTKFNADGSKVVSDTVNGDDGKHETKTNYDADGNRVHEDYKHTGKDGKLVTERTSEFRAGEKVPHAVTQKDYKDGKLIKETDSVRTGPGEEGRVSTSTYDTKTGKRNATETSFTNEKGHLAEKHNQTYDPQTGNLVSVKRSEYDGKGGENPTATNERTFDEKGNMTRVVDQKFVPGTKTAYQTNTADLQYKNGKLVSQHQEHRDGGLESPVTAHRDIKYGANGKQISETGQTKEGTQYEKQFDANGKLVSETGQNKDGSTYNRKCDAEGKPISETGKDKDGVDYAKKFEYNDKGKLTSETTKYNDGTSASKKIEYDADGNPKTQVETHRNGEVSTTNYTHTGEGHGRKTTAETVRRDKPDSEGKPGEILSINKNVSDVHGKTISSQKTDFTYQRDKDGQILRDKNGEAMIETLKMEKQQNQVDGDGHVKIGPGGEPMPEKKVQATILADGGGNFKIQSNFKIGDDGKVVATEKQEGTAPGGTINRLSKDGNFQEALRNLNKIGDGDYMTGLRNLAVLGGNKLDLKMGNVTNMGAKLDNGIKLFEKLAKENGGDIGKAIDFMKGLTKDHTMESAVTAIAEAGRGTANKDMKEALEQMKNASTKGKGALDWLNGLGKYVDAWSRAQAGDSVKGKEAFEKAAKKGKDGEPELGKCLKGACKLTADEKNGKEGDLADSIELIDKHNKGDVDFDIFGDWGGITDAADNMTKSTYSDTAAEAMDKVSKHVDEGAEPGFVDATKNLKADADKQNDENAKLNEERIAKGLPPLEVPPADVISVATDISNFGKKGDEPADFSRGSDLILGHARDTQGGSVQAAFSDIIGFRGSDQTFSLTTAGANIEAHRGVMPAGTSFASAMVDASSFVQPGQERGLTPSASNIELHRTHMPTGTSFRDALLDSSAFVQPGADRSLATSAANIETHRTNMAPGTTYEAAMKDASSFGPPGSTSTFAASAANIEAHRTNMAPGTTFEAAMKDAASFVQPGSDRSFAASSANIESHRSTMGGSTTWQQAMRDASSFVGSGESRSLATSAGNIEAHRQTMGPNATFQQAMRDASSFVGSGQSPSLEKSAANLTQINPDIRTAMTQATSMSTPGDGRTPLASAAQNLQTLNPDMKTAISMVQAAGRDGTFTSGAQAIQQMGGAAKVAAAVQEVQRENPTAHPRDIVAALASAPHATLPERVAAVSSQMQQTPVSGGTTLAKSEVPQSGPVKDNHVSALPAPGSDKPPVKPVSTDTTNVVTHKPTTTPDPVVTKLSKDVPAVTTTAHVTPVPPVKAGSDNPTTKGSQQPPQVVANNNRPGAENLLKTLHAQTTPGREVVKNEKDSQHPRTPPVPPTVVADAKPKPTVSLPGNTSLSFGMNMAKLAASVTADTLAKKGADALKLQEQRLVRSLQEASAAANTAKAKDGQLQTNLRQQGQANVTALNQIRDAGSGSSGKKISDFLAGIKGRPGTNPFGPGQNPFTVGSGATGKGISGDKVLAFTARGPINRRALLGVDIAIAAILISGGVARKRMLAGKKGEGKGEGKAGDLLSASEGSEDLSETSNDDNLQKVQQYQILTRPTWLVRHGEDLCRLAEHLFQDPALGWLIADLNISSSKQSWLDGKRIVELKVRQRLELPVWQDIVEFHRLQLEYAKPENLITIVNETAIENDVMQAALGTVIGGGLPATGLRPQTAAASAATSDGAPAPVPVSVGPAPVQGFASRQEIAGIRDKFAAKKGEIDALLAALKKGSDNDTNNPGAALVEANSEDDGPSASAPVTEDEKPVLKPKFV